MGIGHPIEETDRYRSTTQGSTVTCQKYCAIQNCWICLPTMHTGGTLTYFSLTIRVTNMMKAAFSTFAWLTKICHRSGGCNDGSTKRMQVKTAASPSRSHSSNNYLTWLRLTIVCQNDRRLHWECPLLPVWRAFIHVCWWEERLVSITTATDWGEVTVAVCQNSSPALSHCHSSSHCCTLFHTLPHLHCDRPTWRSLHLDD